MTGAGTGAAGSAIGYTVTNQDAFDTNSFVETTAVGGAIGGISAVTPVSGLGVVAKTATHIAGAEALYALQTENWTVTGAQNAAIGGTIGAVFDVGGSLFVESMGTHLLSDLYRPSSPPGYLAPNQDILASAARIRAGENLINSVTGVVSGATAALTTYLWDHTHFIPD